MKNDQLHHVLMVGQEIQGLESYVHAISPSAACTVMSNAQFMGAAILTQQPSLLMTGPSATEQMIQIRRNIMSACIGAEELLGGGRHIAFVNKKQGVMRRRMMKSGAIVLPHDAFRPRDLVRHIESILSVSDPLQNLR